MCSSFMWHVLFCWLDTNRTLTIYMEKLCRYLCGHLHHDGQVGRSLGDQIERAFKLRWFSGQQLKMQSIIGQHLMFVDSESSGAVRNSWASIEVSRFRFLQSDFGRINFSPLSRRRSLSWQTSRDRPVSTTAIVLCVVYTSIATLEVTHIENSPDAFEQRNFSDELANHWLNFSALFEGNKGTYSRNLWMTSRVGQSLNPLGLEGVHMSRVEFHMMHGKRMLYLEV